MSLVVVVAVSYRSIVAESESDHWVRHTHEVLECLQNLSSDVLALESTYRGFALTGTQSYIDSYRAAIASAEGDEAAVANLTVDNPKQQDRLPKLKALITRKVEYGDMIISLRSTAGLRAAADAIADGQGQQIMDDLLRLVRAMENEERRLLVLREKDAKQRFLQTEKVVIFGTLIGLLVAAAAGWRVKRETSMRELAESLRESQERERLFVDGARFRGLLEAAPDAMVVVNESGEIVLLNVQAEKQFGYSRDELVGQQAKVIIPEGFAERLIADRTRSAADAQSQQIGTGIELSGQRKDGSEFPVEIMLSPLESAEGVLITAAIRDISARKLEESKILALTERLALATEIASLGVWNSDLASGTLAWDAKMLEIYGFPPGPGLILYEKWTTAVHPEDLPAAEAALRGLVHEKNQGFAEFRITRADGAIRHIAASGKAVLDDRGNVVRVIGINMDITERKRSEEHLAEAARDLKRSNDELQQFAYVASHDLQEPLRMVASFTQLLSKRYTGRLDSDADDFIAFAVDGCNRMQGLIQDLLFYSRAGSGAKALLHISSEGAFHEALSNLGAAVERSGAVVTRGPLPTLATDADQLVQVLQNLIGNAIKYRGAGIPHIHVSASKSDGHEWVFSVRDDGLGIAPEHFERIFVLFQRLHGRHEFEGSGIGLAICRKILEAQGGRIWVESEPGQGSTFLFALPEREEKR